MSHVKMCEFSEVSLAGNDEFRYRKSIANGLRKVN